MRLIIQSEAVNVAKWSAVYIARRINESAKQTAKPFVLGLPTGSTPLGTYKGAYPNIPCREGFI